MKKFIPALTVGLALAVACQDSTGVNNPNSLPVTSVQGPLTHANLQTLVTGILNGGRGSFGLRYIYFSEGLARDAVRLDPSEPRFVTELLGNTIDASGFVGGSAFTGFTLDVSSENQLLAQLDKPNMDTITAGQVLAAKGFVQTFKALDLYRIAALRDSLGVPTDNTDPLHPTPLQCKTAALARMSVLLDSAVNNLRQAQTAGETGFPFTLPAGFMVSGDYTQISNFVLFNRGLKGKIEVYRGLDHTNYNPATNTISAAGLQNMQTARFALDTALGTPVPGGVPASALANGPYYQYSTAAGETQNPVASDVNLHLNRSVVDSILPGDLRASKIANPTVTYSRYGYKAKGDPSIALPSAANSIKPLAILRNGELVLLRAQAYIHLNNLAAATADLNTVHVNAGGLAPYPVFTTQADAINALLYEKRYSLLFEGAQRLVDLRAYGRLNSANFRKESTSDAYNSVLPIPIAEINARGGGAIVLVCQ